MWGATYLPVKGMVRALELFFGYWRFECDDKSKLKSVDMLLLSKRGSDGFCELLGRCERG